jgi:TFIIF-interacting CTD phosphatase-like protein
MFDTLKDYFVFGVFTAGQKAYADFVIEKIDPKEEFIKFRFYRDNCKQMTRFQVKDLNLVA